MLFLWTVLAALPSGMIGFWLRKRVGLSSVETSGWIALTSGIIFPVLHNDGLYLAAVSTCVSYAAMSSGKRVSNQLQMLTVSLLCAVIMYYGRECLVGIGGRLGAFAALATLAFCGIKYLIDIIDQVRHTKKETDAPA